MPKTAFEDETTTFNKKYYNLAELLENRSNIEFLINEIERLSIKN